MRAFHRSVVCTAFVAAGVLAGTFPAVGAALQQRVATPSRPATPTGGEIPITSKSPQAIEAYKAGRDLFENSRVAEGAEQMKRALAIDPDFALAHAFLGAATPGAVGLESIERALALAKGVPPAERYTIELLAAQRRGESKNAEDAARRLAEAAPDDWRAQTYYGQTLAFANDYDNALPALRRGTELNPKAGPAWNLMGYAYLNQGKMDQAIECLRKYADLNPTEPNPHDSLGEALLGAGRYPEAEAAFRRAVEISPSFSMAWQGLAQTRFARGDWAGGREILSKAKPPAPRAVERLQVDLTLAASFFAEGKREEAMKTLDAVEQETRTQKVDEFRPFVLLLRAGMQILWGQYEPALRSLDRVLAAGEESKLPEGAIQSLRWQVYSARVDARCRMGDLEKAKESLAALESEAKTASGAGDPMLQSNLHIARGNVAMAAGDARSAAAHFAKCREEDTGCHWKETMAREKAGDAAGAKATRDRILSFTRRDPTYLYFRSALTGGVGSGAAPR